MKRYLNFNLNFYPWWAHIFNMHICTRRMPIVIKTYSNVTYYQNPTHQMRHSNKQHKQQYINKKKIIIKQEQNGEKKNIFLVFYLFAVFLLLYCYYIILISIY
jgi:hypothetical protein